MNIYDFALQMEQDREAFYRDLAAKTADPGIQRILTSLAEDEHKHYLIISQLQDEAASPEMLESTVLSSARDVFAQMQDRPFDTEGMQVEVYRQAQELERQSREYYQAKAEEVDNPGHKAILLRLALEENRHYVLLDHIAEFLDRPRTWIEDAEFTHLDEY